MREGQPPEPQSAAAVDAPAGLTGGAVVLRAWMRAASAALADNIEQINDLNVFPVPDADTGTNSNATFQAAVAAVAALPDDADAATMAQAMGRAAALGARGNSGVILSQMLRGVSQAAIDPDRPFTAVALARVLDSAATSGREAVADPRDGTMLSVMSDAAAAAEDAVSTGDVAAVAVAAADAARRSLEDTPNHLAVLASAGVVDAGGRAIVVVLDALAEVLTGTARPAWQAPVLTKSCDIDSVAADYDGPAYEVMYVLHADAPAVADVRAQLVSLGDSLAVVGGDGLWNVHVHVDDPAAAVDIGRAAGHLESIRISFLRTGFPSEPVDGSVTLIAAVAASPLAENLEATGVVTTTLGEAAVAEAISRSAGDVIVCVPRRLDVDGATGRVAQVLCPTPVHVIAAAAVWDAAVDFDALVNRVAAAVAGVTTASVVADGDAFLAVASGSRERHSTLIAATSAAVKNIRTTEHEIATVVVDPSQSTVVDDLAARVLEDSGLEAEIVVCPVPGAVAVIGLE